ncbi:hypothetical protein GE061_008212 [Apolygus lucorum]|uniref:DNA replication ATP-dependent helicase/nuclease n=1 Tax=Apolygus lucorum TaxID=248454 RepID=A0A6A4IZW8_APOLU|nr:hypothetical protein GE061_008212 [Apolygus lucorum]
MKKTTLNSKKQQPTLTSFFARKPSSQPNGFPSQKSVEPPVNSETNDSKRKRAFSPQKSPAKSKKFASPSKIKSPSKTIEEFLSPGKSPPRKLSIAVKKTNVSSSSVDEICDLEKRDVQFTSPEKSSSAPNGLRRSPRLAEAANRPTPEKSTEAVRPKVFKRTKLFSPVKDEKKDVSPHKNGCSKNGAAEMGDFDFSGLDEAFLDDIDAFDSCPPPPLENLNLAKLDRYKVESSTSLITGDLRLVVKNVGNATGGTCTIKSPWNSSVVREGDIVSLRGTCVDGEWVVEWSGLLVTNPDNLISGTSVVGSLFCMRKAVLSEIFEELGASEYKHLVIGCVVHQLLQEVLQKKIREREGMEKICEDIIGNRDFVVDLFLKNVNYSETVQTIRSYLPRIYDFVSTYVTYGKAERLAPKGPDGWPGEIVTIKDIEENIWSPTLGIKGKIDATLQVKINRKSKVMPLELKTGKVSFSMEHRGQVILYCMLLKELGEFVDSGLLLYLKDEGGMKEISAGDREIRDLVLLRNCLSKGLLDLSNVSPSDNIPLPELPPPINRKSCDSCGHLVACSAALRERGLETLSERHRMKQLVPEVTSHLSSEHAQFIFHWIGLQSLENGCSLFNIANIWSENPKTREENGTCLTRMMVSSSVVTKGARFESVFTKADKTIFNEIFNVGQTVVVSSDSQIGITYGFVNSISPISVTLSVEKFFKVKEGPFMLDAYESGNTKKISLKNLSLLLEDSERARIMREIVIDLKLPAFAPKISGKIRKLGMDIFEKLNKEQVRALLQAISADTYILIQGMPGTGKTTTMRALIQLLVRMDKRVLVSSYTHSAIDNILVGLVGKVDMMRVVNPNRAHPKLKDVTERACLNKLTNPCHEQLEKMYKSKKVVGVSCLSAGHLWLERQTFDVCLVDEASQVTLPAVLRPIFLAKKFILVGDPKQLPPLVVNEKAKEFGLGKSLFHRLDRPAVTSQLTQQYRMNQKITDIANGFAYENMLKCGSDDVANATLDYRGTVTSSDDWMQRSLSKLLEDSVIVIDVKNGDIPKSSGKSKDNRAEADVIVQIAKEMIKVGVKGASIGVIATYREQVELLKNLLGGTEIEISTVDQYQGRDKEVILYSSSKSSNKVESDILSDTNRLTVAITRAKKKLIIVCHLDFLKTYDNFAKMFNHVPPSNFLAVTPTS